MTRRLIPLLAFVLLAPGAAPAGTAPGQPRESLTAADNAKARSVVIRRTDLNPLFRPAPNGSATDIIPHCAGYPGDRSSVTITGEAVSGFAYGADKVGSSVSFFKSQFDAERYWKLTVRKAFAPCKAYWLRRLLKRGVTGRTLRAGELALDRTGADADAAYRVVTRLYEGGKAAYDLYDVTAFVRVGRGVAIDHVVYGIRPCVCYADISRLLVRRLSEASRTA